jgi:lipid II:glycine glycyltransferase (peptidoglycan interpeptide bridge formation enzyme)
MIDIRQSIQYANYLKSQGWTVERINKTNYFIKKFSIIGSILKLQRPEKIDFDTINKLCRKYRVFQTIIESISTDQSQKLINNGFKLSKSPYLPSKTLQIDLRQSEKTILGHFKKDSRSAVKRGEVKNTKIIRTPSDIGKWHKAWKKSVNFMRYVPTFDTLINIRNNFDDNNHLFLASHNIVGRIIGGALFTKTSHGVAYYWYGFTNDEGRSTLSQYSLLWGGLLWAKKSGCKIFDFEGIYDSRFPNKSWLGFTHFKKSFGGVEVLYPGCYTKFRFPL